MAEPPVVTPLPNGDNYADQQPNIPAKKCYDGFMSNTVKCRLIGYRRVSTAGQVDRYGLPAQETDLRAYACARHRLVRIETDDAKPGSLPASERPGLLAALKAIEEGEADGLLVPVTSTGWPAS